MTKEQRRVLEERFTKWYYDTYPERLLVEDFAYIAMLCFDELNERHEKVVVEAIKWVYEYRWFQPNETPEGWKLCNSTPKHMKENTVPGRKLWMRVRKNANGYTPNLVKAVEELDK